MTDGGAAFSEIAGEGGGAEVFVGELVGLRLEAAHRLDGDAAHQQQADGERAEGDGQSNGQPEVLEGLH